MRHINIVAGNMPTSLCTCHQFECNLESNFSVHASTGLLPAALLKFGSGALLNSNNSASSSNNHTHPLGRQDGQITSLLHLEPMSCSD
jgi:hypothetical protein